MYRYANVNVQYQAVEPPVLNLVLYGTQSRAIAKEFAGKRDGYLHILHLRKGVRIKDFSEFYDSDLVRREKEVLLYPGQKLVLIKRVGNTLTWEVYPKA